MRRRLAENDLKPWRRDMWCIPQVDGEYVARMEDVLDLYAEPSDPRHAARARINWMFTTEKARAKMGRAYPKPATPAGRGQRVKTSVTRY